MKHFIIKVMDKVTGNEVGQSDPNIVLLEENAQRLADKFNVENPKNRHYIVPKNIGNEQSATT